MTNQPTNVSFVAALVNVIVKLSLVGFFRTYRTLPPEDCEVARTIDPGTKSNFT
jgi:hypothetical protein